MTDGLRPYREYKDPAIPSIDRIPQHWEIRRNGLLFAQRNETGFGDLPILEVSLRTGVRVRDMNNGQRKQVMSDREKYKRAAKGDIAYNMMRMWQGAVGVVPADGLVSPAYVVARPYADTESRYFAYLFRTDPYKGEIDAFSRGIVKDRNRLYWEDFKRMPACVPPTDEQRAISDYLDGNAVTVRRFIRNRRRLIEVLNEQKRAIIINAVTKGLNRAARLKPSGIDWLGDVPTHWEVDRIRACLADTRAGIWGDDPTSANAADHVICLRVADFDMPRLGISAAKLTLRAVPQSARTPRLLVPGDILMEKSGGGEAEPVGRVVLYDEHVAPNAISSNFIVRLRPNRARVEPRYLLNVLAMMQATRRNVPWIKQTTGIQNLDERAYLSLAIGVPSLDEQRHIIDGLAELLRPADRAIAQASREIDLIHEYRTRLIADIVTGKLDVRGFVPAGAALTDEPIDDAMDEGEMDDDETELVEEAVDAAD